MTEAQGGEADLEATGERLIPERQRGEVVHAEHFARYLTAAQLAPARRVLDAACGEGYGTAMLAAAGAASATGVDVDEATISHARVRYPAAEFVEGDVSALPFDDASFDLVVSFETIEHVSEPERALDEYQRVMARDGLLLISTPNKHQYLVDNPFHEREFTHEEFLELLSARFPHTRLLLQHNWVATGVLPTEVASDESGRLTPTGFAKFTGLAPGAELYSVVLCGSEPLPEIEPVVVGATVDEAHELARRLVSAEAVAADWHARYLDEVRTAKVWHEEYKRTEAALLGLYASVWWRLTRPLRWLVERVKSGNA